MIQRISCLDALLAIAEGVSLPDEVLPIPTVRLVDLFTSAEIRRVQNIIRNTKDDTAVISLIDRTVVTPIIDRINDRTGQVNDPRYLAYAVYNALRNEVN